MPSKTWNSFALQVVLIESGRTFHVASNTLLASAIPGTSISAAVTQQVRPPYEVHRVDVMQGGNQAPEDDRLRFGELSLGES